MDADRTVYVYGVVPAAEPSPIKVPGVQDAEVRTVRHGGLAALTSHVQGETLVAAREVRAHWRVLDEASQDRTVLPIRFGTVLESEEAVREQLLEPNAERLEALLRGLAGCVQLSVKGSYDEERLLRDVVTRSPAIAELRDRLRTVPGEAGYYERIRLGELVASEIERRRGEDTRLVYGRLQPLAKDAIEEEGADPHAAFNLAFLVARDAQPEFSKAVSTLAKELGERIEIRFVGPLPPYSFASAELESAGSEAWA
jgi:hypothetical protein